MIEKIKNTTILGKTVRPDNGKTLKRVQGDKFGFTLAEVLITLGIIGVVAAMTMPTLIAKIQKNVLKNQFKKTYSVLSNAVQKAVFELDYNTECYYQPHNGAINVGCISFFKEYLIKNLNITKICDGNGYDDGCLPDYNWGVLNNESCGAYTSSSLKRYAYVIVMNDGSFIFTYSNSANWPMIGFDVNGKKGPNKPGHDVFIMSMYKSGNNITFGRLYSSDGKISIVDCLNVSEDGFKTYDEIMK